MNGKSIFFTEVFSALNTLQQNDKNHCFIFDVMSVKKQILWDEKSRKFIGNFGMGNELKIEGTNLQQLRYLYLC